MIKRIISIVLLCVVLADTVMAKNENEFAINGIIKEKTSGEGIPGVVVTIKKIESNKTNHTHKESLFSGIDGSFIFPALCKGNYILTAEAAGYITAEKTIDLNSGTLNFIELELSESAFVMDEVVVSASRNEISRKSAPVVVNVLNQKTFQAVNACDLAQGLNFQSGLRVENNCQNCGFPQVRINGLDGPYSQTLIDSRPIMSALSGVYGLEQIPVNMIDRVEIIRGGGSALFGSNAVGGTINIITREPVENYYQVSSNVTALGGEAMQTQVNGNVALVSKDNSAGISVYQTYRERNPLDIDGDGFSELGKINARNFGFRGYIRPVGKNKLTVEYHTSNEFRRGGNKFDLQPHQTDITEQTDHSINGGGATYDMFFDGYKHKLSVYSSAQHISRKSYYGTNQDENAYGKTKDLTWLTGSTYVTNLDKCLVSPATLTLGAEYYYNDLHDVMLGYNRDLKQNIHIGSGFIQNEWKSNELSLLAGFRLDKHNLIDHLIFSPRVNLLYKPSDKIQGRLTFSSGFRAPQAYDEDLHVAAVGGEGMVIKLSPNLKEERSYSYSGSIDVYNNWDNWQANLLSEFFYTDLRDVFVLEALGHDENGYQIQERRNGSGAYVCGLNLDAKLAYMQIVQLQMGFTVQTNRFKKAHYWSDTADPVKKMLRTPNNYGYMTFVSNLTKAFQASVTGTYTGKMYVPHFAGYIEQDRLERSSRFFDMSLKLSYDFNLKKNVILQINGGIQNIFDSRQKDFDQGAMRDSKYFYGPTLPRSYYVGIRISNL